MKLKQIISLFLLVAMVLCLVPAEVYASGAFTDVYESDYFYAPVEWAVEKGITTGVGNGKFAPDDFCTRGQIVTFLWRAAGKPEPKTQKNPFADVTSRDYFYTAVLWAVEKGITTGVDATHFAPEEICTRAQAATFLYRAEGNTQSVEASCPFTDVQSGQYYYTPVLWALAYGITTGVSKTEFAPDAECTRGQIVTFLYRNHNKTDEVVLNLHESEITLTVGDTYTMTYKYTGTKTLTWSSSNTAVCTVSNGIITAKSAGTATITLTDGDKSAQCKVTVKAKETINVTLDITESNKTVYVGDSCNLTYKYTGNKTLTWSSSDASVATVDNNGNVTAKKAGTTTIKVTDGSKSDTCAIIVNEKESSDVGTLTINTKKDTTVYIGETLQIDYTYTGDKSKLNFKSSKESVLTVNNSGLVTGVGDDYAWIYVYHDNIELGKLRLRSKPRPSGPKAESIGSGEFTGPYFNGTYGVVGNYMTFWAWARTSGNNQKVTATSSNTSVATVTIYRDWDGSGMSFKVSFVGAGSTTITITSDDKNVSTSYNLNVKSGYGYGADGLLSPEEFAMYANKVMADNGARIDPTGGYRVLTLSSSDLTWYNARACAEAWVREFWPCGITAMGLAYQGMNEDGKHVFYIHC